MRARITQRLAELKAQQQYLLQESLKVAGAIAVLEDLLTAQPVADAPPLEGAAPPAAAGRGAQP